MTRHPLSAMEEAADLVTLAAAPAADVVVRFFVAEVDEIETVTGDTDPVSGFVRADVRTRPLVGAAFAAPADMKAALEVRGGGRNTERETYSEGEIECECKN